MTNKSIDRSRRAFLAFAGRSGIAHYALKRSTLLAGLLANRYARANGRVRRVVFVFTPLGSPSGLWLPDGNELNTATRAYEGLQEVCHFHETYVVHGGVGHPYKALSELRFEPDWTSDTIDHQIAKVLSVANPFPSLHFGVQATSVGVPADSFTRKNLKPVLPMEEPGRAYERLFGTEPSHSRANAVKGNVMDAHRAALNCARSQLSSLEIATLDEYEASLAELRGQVADVASQTPACRLPDWNAQGYETRGSREQQRGVFAHQAYLQAEIIGHALACGLTNVTTLQLGDDHGSFVGHDTQFQRDLHQASCGAPITAYAEMVNYLSRCVAYLIRQLAAQDDPAVPGTKLLDNTLVLQVSNQGDGPTHSGYDGPNLLATRMPEFKTGVARNTGTSGSNNLTTLQTVAAGLGLEAYIGKEDHHCIWPCGNQWGGVDTTLLA